MPSQAKGKAAMKKLQIDFNIADDEAPKANTATAPARIDASATSTKGKVAMCTPIKPSVQGSSISSSINLFPSLGNTPAPIIEAKWNVPTHVPQYQRSPSPKIASSPDAENHPLPPRPAMCTSEICLVPDPHFARAFAQGDKDLPKKIKDAQARVGRARARRETPDRRDQNFLDIFYSVHRARRGQSLSTGGTGQASTVTGQASTVNGQASTGGTGQASTVTGEASTGTGQASSVTGEASAGTGQASTGT